MVLVAMVEEIVAFLIEKMVVDDKGARWEPMVRLRMKERYIEKSDFDADEELLWLPLPRLDLDQTSTGGQLGRREPQPGKEGYWKRESVFDTPRSDLD
uniref:Uncharacterized protein n=1 Tax=Vitis vinifera TaxID=29760 RepID=A5BQ97_VITVI|nr:hypothetical protein VITISV_010490 [Vitis vinifera]